MTVRLRIPRILCFLVAVLWLGQAMAVIEIAPLSNSELESRYRDLIEELRCPKCQNQNLADSNSPISADMREVVREKLEAGWNDEEIIAFLVERYGDFVRYRPAVKSSTFVLWFAPLGFVFLALIVAAFFVRKQKRSVATAKPLSQSEQATLDALLSEDKPEER